MKQILLVFLVAYIGWHSAVAQCNPFYNFEEDSKWEMTSYNSKDKVMGRQISEIKQLDKTASGWTALIHMTAYDKKDDVAFENDVELECDEGVIKMDMSRFMPEETLKSMEEMDMTIEVDNMEWPSDLSVGSQLDDGSITISGGFFNMTVDITDRKVEGKEKVTTPAGTFDAFKVSYTIKTKMMMNMETKGVDYIADDVGVVKSESYDKNGKLDSYTLLTSYE